MKAVFSIVTTCLLAAILALSFPAILFGQQGQTCIGRFCGREMGFDAEHCHIRPGGDVDGDDYCWSSLPFDLACEDLGYTVNLPCPQGAAEFPGLGAGLVSLSPSLLGGYDTFRSEIRTGAVSRAAAEESGAEESEEEAAAASRSLRFSTITTALEHEQWELAGADGDTTGLRLDWERQTEAGWIWGVAGSYQDANPDRGQSTQLARGQFNLGRIFAADDASEWKWTLHGTVADVSGGVSDTLFGGGGSLAYRRYASNGHVFSAGLLAQVQTSDDLDDDVQTVGAGLGYGFPIAQRLTLDFELFGTTLLDDVVEEDTFYTAAALLGVYLSPRFALTVGTRTLQGIDDLDSTTFTLGTSTRF